MRPRLVLALGGVAVFAAALNGVLTRLRGPALVSPAVLARASGLSRGMGVYDVLETLHPGEMRRVGGFSCETQVESGMPRSFHALSRDRYLRLTWLPQIPIRTARYAYPRPLGRHRQSEGQLASWRIVSGRAPREDFAIGRTATLMGVTFSY